MSITSIQNDLRTAKDKIKKLDSQLSAVKRIADGFSNELVECKKEMVALKHIVYKLHKNVKLKRADNDLVNLVVNEISKEDDGDRKMKDD